MSSVRTEGSAHMGQSTAPTTPIDLEDEDPNELRRQMMADLSLTWSYLNETFEALQEQTEQFIAHPAQPWVDPEEIQAVGDDIDIHSWEMAKELGELKARLPGDVKREVTEAVRARAKADDWAALIRAEAAREVRAQVAAQISEHLPESLQAQVAETQRQVEGVRISLQNSQARMANSFIGSTNIDDPLSPIVTPGGVRSAYYPPSARALFGYDLEAAKTLNMHYELTETDDLHVNFQQFLRHIGTGVEVAVSPR